jgi:hypothetical protein
MLGRPARVMRRSEESCLVHDEQNILERLGYSLELCESEEKISSKLEQRQESSRLTI